MRSVYITHTSSEFDQIFARGAGDIQVYKSPRPRGGSLFGVLTNVVKSSIPFLRKIFLPEIPSLVNDIIDNSNSGENVKDRLKRVGLNTIKRVGKRILKGGQKSKKRDVKRLVKGKKKVKDVFNTNRYK